MMSCGRDPNVLSAYLDGELPPGEEEQLLAHLRSCSACAAEIAAAVSLRRALRPAASRFAPSQEFRRRIQSRIAPRRGFTLPWLWPLVTAALAVIMVVMVWSHERARGNQVYGELADLHVSDLASANPYDVVSSDRHTVKPWFQGKIPFAFNLPEFSGSEFTLLGGRLVFFDQQPAAQVVVGVGQHKISVLMIASSEHLGRALPVANGVAVQDSFNVETWEGRGLRFFVIGDADKETIERLSESFERVNP